MGFSTGGLEINLLKKLIKILTILKKCIVGVFFMTGIYMIRNKVNNKMYIGQTGRDIKNRLNEYLQDLRTNKHYNSYLQNAWNKYGEDNFEFKVLQECDEEDLNTFETLYINILKTLAPDGYNLKEGGSNGKHTKETKQKISKACKGKKTLVRNKKKYVKNCKKKEQAKIIHFMGKNTI